MPKGQPYNHGHLESFNGSLRDELLDAQLFHRLGETRAKVQTWLNLELWQTTTPQRAPVATLPPPSVGLLGNFNHDY